MFLEVPIVEQTVSHNGDFRVQVSLLNSLHGWNQELSPNFPGFYALSVFSTSEATNDWSRSSLCESPLRPTRWTPQNFIESTLRICSFSEIIFLTFSLQFSSCSSFTPKKSKFQRLLYSSCFTSRVLFEFASFSTWLIRPLLSPYSFWVNSRESLKLESSPV